ncbi:MAG: fibronectin type III domain-containing protein [Deltaproteobacteria bacterium]|nr:MAG: fibronectin type III domain-containing protein [Deltaproteobacteria bacterium]
MTTSGAAPPQPIDVVVTALPIKRIRVTWTASPGAAGYEIERAVDGGGGTPTWIVVDDAVPQPPDMQAEYVVEGAFLPAWADSAVRIRACNFDGCSPWSTPVAAQTVDPGIALVKDQEPQIEARFGTSVATSADGRVVAIGAPQYDDGTQLDRGRVLTASFDGVSEAWQAMEVPIPTDVGAGGAFGGNVALDAAGLRLAVSAKGLDGGLGGVVVYDWDDRQSGWGAGEILRPSMGAAGDLTAERSIALSADGQWLAAGSTIANRVVVWRRNMDLWEESDVLDGTDYDPMTARFGYGLAFSADGTVLAVGAAGSPALSGKVHVFERSGGAFSHVASLEPDVSETATMVLADGFGASLALSADGTRLAVGVPFDDGSQGGIGADSSSKSTATAASGAVYLFDAPTPGSWSKTEYFKAEMPRENDWYGFAVAMSADGLQIAVAARLEDGGGVGLHAGPDTAQPDAGAVYVYREVGGTWTLLRYVKAFPVADSGDRFGRGLALSSDGRTLAVGANEEDGPDADPFSNGVSNAGAVYVY